MPPKVKMIMHEQPKPRVTNNLHEYLYEFMVWLVREHAIRNIDVPQVRVKPLTIYIHDLFQCEYDIPKPAEQFFKEIMETNVPYMFQLDELPMVIYPFYFGTECVGVRISKAKVRTNPVKENH